MALLLSLAIFEPAFAQTEEEFPIVRAILFYSPTCPHCHQVIQEDIPPLIEKFGNQLLIIGINTQTIEGQEIYQAMIEQFEVPDERLGVPALVVGETVLVGSGEIPALFPKIIEDGLEEGGIDWPPIPGFVEAYTASVAAATAQAEATPTAVEESTPTNTATDTSQKATPTLEPTAENTAQVSNTAQPLEPTSTPEAIDPTSTPEQEATAEQAENSVEEGSPSLEMDLPDSETFIAEDQTMIEKFQTDPVGNSASVVVLLGMVVSLGGIWRQLNKRISATRSWERWVIPVLCAIGLVVAGYLSFVEITQSKAVCGPVGDCNTVQQSPYARLFGILPVGVLGLAGYIAISIAWGLQYYGPETWRKLAAQAVWGFALFGTLFSIYLTFLEPFVIGATCAWCLTSAIVITMIMWAATNPLRQR